MKNKIGWCNLTWNPVWGCLNKCPYCYARSIAKRFSRKMAKLEYKNYICDVGEDGYDVMRWIDNLKERLKFFMPTFLYSQFDKKLPKKSQRIFVGSMSEIFYWERRWMEVVLGKILCHPEHSFQFLTRYPDIYLRYDFPKNCWLGMTIADSKYFNYDDYQKFKISNPNNLKFVSYEPLLDEIFVNLQGIDWIIVGAETGNRKGKIIPKREWVEDIVEYCRRKNIPIYLKDSLKNIYSREIKEFPEMAKGDKK